MSSVRTLDSLPCLSRKRTAPCDEAFKQLKHRPQPNLRFGSLLDFWKGSHSTPWFLAYKPIMPLLCTYIPVASPLAAYGTLYSCRAAMELKEHRANLFTRVHRLAKVIHDSAFLNHCAQSVHIHSTLTIFHDIIVHATQRISTYSTYQ